MFFFFYICHVHSLYLVIYLILCIGSLLAIHVKFPIYDLQVLRKIMFVVIVILYLWNPLERLSNRVAIFAILIVFARSWLFWLCLPDLCYFDCVCQVFVILIVFVKSFVILIVCQNFVILFGFAKSLLFWVCQIFVVILMCLSNLLVVF